MKRKNFIIFALCTLTAIAFAGCNKLNLDDPLLSGGNNAGINAGNNSSITTDDPAALINAAYEKNLAATSCTITFSTGNTFEGDEAEQAGTESDFDKFVITSDTIFYETGEVWITLDGETSETRTDDKAYISGTEEYYMYLDFDEDFNDVEVVTLYIHEEGVDAKEYIKDKAKLPIDTYKDAFDALADLELTATKEDDGSVVLAANDLELSDFSTIMSNLINATPQSIESRFNACTEFGVEATINKDGYATSIIISAKDMPMYMTDDNDKFIDYSFSLEMTDINTATVTKPDFVENYVPGTTGVTYVYDGWELEYRYNWNDTNEYSFYARMDEINPTNFGQYEVLTEINEIKVDVMGSNMWQSLEEYTFEIIVPQGMAIDLSMADNFTAIYCNDTKEEVYNLFKSSPYGTIPDEWVENTLLESTIYYAGEWSYVDGVATPN